MGTLSCLLPSSSHSHLPHIRHRQPALDADADELASAVNALPGSPNATTTGQPNGTPLKWHRLSSLLTLTIGLVVVKKALSSQWLASARNISRGRPMRLHTGSSMVRHPRLAHVFATHLHCQTTSASSSPSRCFASASMSLRRAGPIPRRSGSSMVRHSMRVRFDKYPARFDDAKQVHQCPNELAQCHWYRVAQWCVTRLSRMAPPPIITPRSSPHLVLDLTMRRKCINVFRAYSRRRRLKQPNGASLDRSTRPPSDQAPQPPAITDATQERQCSREFAQCHGHG